MQILQHPKILYRHHETQGGNIPRTAARSRGPDRRGECAEPLVTSARVEHSGKPGHIEQCLVLRYDVTIDRLALYRERKRGNSPVSQFSPPCMGQCGAFFERLVLGGIGAEVCVQRECCVLSEANDECHRYVCHTAILYHVGCWRERECFYCLT